MTVCGLNILPRYSETFNSVFSVSNLFDFEVVLFV